MAIKPILFNTEMVRAILDGRKSCTRRICKDANEYTVPDMDFYNADRRTYAVHNFSDKEHTEQLSIAERTCPICPGDILYVRETWQYLYELDGNEQVIEDTGKYYYAATDTIHPHAERSGENLAEGYGCTGGAVAEYYRRGSDQRRSRRRKVPPYKCRSIRMHRLYEYWMD